MFFAGKVAAKIAPRQTDWVKAIQRRVGMTASMLANMKSVKMMGLSEILFDSLQSQRVRELNLSKRFRVMMMWRMLLCKGFAYSKLFPLTQKSFRSRYRRTIGMLCDICYSSLPGWRKWTISEPGFLFSRNYLPSDLACRRLSSFFTFYRHVSWVLRTDTVISPL